MVLKKGYRAAKYSVIKIDRKYGRPIEKLVGFESWPKPAKAGLAVAIAVGYVGSKGLASIGWYEAAKLSNELWKYCWGNPANFGSENLEKIGMYLGGSFLFTIIESGGFYIGGKYFWKKYKQYKHEKSQKRLNLLSNEQNLLHELKSDKKI